ncbi:hypothetical protein DB35_10420 [Streptomyces abyssalis]|uniref:Uncharacterized protein n=1 Tax=Streptomyces abyssalis TaxID=933944 RepID=A0A1E7JHY5_9ACTN|nr:DUF6411 family protein [Streptomyces abyssalis]OEU86067.1 hypothetical protein AN215_27480 [Streptomyces abyssalis]OEU92467.1 hypothetical protein DB35_10420 [Streptomyces abyssalis]OEV28808.1 hypothetical protein AN219_19810 [Streptomyces nanshensis]
MVIGIVVVCVVLAVLAFLLPRFSHRPQRGAQRSLGAGTQVAGKAPGKSGRLLSKPFRSSSRAVGKSGRAGRRARRRMPF